MEEQMNGYTQNKTKTTTNTNNVCNSICCACVYFDNCNDDRKFDRLGVLTFRYLHWEQYSALQPDIIVHTYTYIGIHRYVCYS